MTASMIYYLLMDLQAHCYPFREFIWQILRQMYDDKIHTYRDISVCTGNTKPGNTDFRRGRQVLQFL